ncbi:unnamed protein product, partial [Ascophyllum nodosum]
LRTKNQAAASSKQNRWSIVGIMCEQGGKPDERRRAPMHTASRRTASKKSHTPSLVPRHPFSCRTHFSIAALFPIAQNSMCLKNHVGSSNDSGIEHERPRVHGNELSVEEIAGQVDFISRLHFSGVKTKEIHKSLQAPGKRLGEEGKTKVRNMRLKLDKERSEERGPFNDAQMFVLQLQQENCWMRFKTDEDGRMMCIAWAHEAQQLNALRYHSIIIQDNTFNTNIYKYHLALIVVVDKENHTQLAIQALLLREQTEYFVFLFEAFKELCAGADPQVIFTDADQAAMSAIEQVYPSSLNKLCLYHINQNIRKHGGGLGEGVLAAVVGMFHAAAYAQTEEFFLQHKVDLLRLLPRESHMYEYMDKYIFVPGRVQKWASHVHPGLHTLSIASTQRVESSNSALKLVMTRSGTMVDVDRAIVGKVQDDANKPLRVNSGGRVDRVRVKNVSPAERVNADLLERFHFVKEAMLYERCSGYAMEDMATQILASLGYSAQPVASGNDEVQRLLAELVPDPKKAKLQYDTNSGEFMDPSRMSTSSAGVTMATRTSVPHFAELLEDQTVNELVRITPLMAYTEYGHLIALGPDGFFLCTCLRQLVDGLGCPHGLRAIGTGRGGRGGRGSRGRGGGRGRDWRRGEAEAGGEERASTGRGEGREEGRGGAEGGRGSAGPGVLAAGLSVLQPAADASATRAGCMGLDTTPANSAHAFGASRMPPQSLSNAGIDAPCGGGEQASPSLEPLPSTPQDVAILEQLQPVERQKHTGLSRRH